MQRNSTILDSQNEIPPFNPDSSLTLPRRDRMRDINYEGRRLSQLSLVHNSTDESILTNNLEKLSSTPSPFLRREKYCSSAPIDFTLQQLQQEQNDIDIHPGLNCMQNVNSWAKLSQSWD